MKTLRRMQPKPVDYTETQKKTSSYGRSLTKSVKIREMADEARRHHHAGDKLAAKAASSARMSGAIEHGVGGIA